MNHPYGGFHLAAISLQSCIIRAEVVYRAVAAFGCRRTGGTVG